MVRKITGTLLMLAAAVVIWLFPALVTPRYGRPHDGQDFMQYHQAEMAKEQRSARLALWVCVPAGIVLGIGLSLFVAGIRRSNRTEPGVGR